MKESIINIIIIITIFIITFPFWAFSLYTMVVEDPSRYPQGFSGHYEYELVITSWYDVPVTNVTLLIPLPSWSSPKPKVNFSITDDVFARQGTIVGESPPPDYHLSVQQKQNRSFVKFTADSLKPRYKYVLLFAMTVPGDITAPPINITDPIGHEMLFYQQPDSFSLVSSTEGRKISYVLPLYADYSTPSDSLSILLRSSIQGKNSWQERWEYWKENRYVDGFSVSLSNKAPGWTTVGAELESRMGYEYSTTKPGIPP